MPIFAVLVDGGFVKKKLGSAAKPFDVTVADSFCKWLVAHAHLTGMRLHRIYFYDARPLDGKAAKPLGGAEYNFNAHSTFQINQKFHEQVVRLPFVSLRMGELTHRGWTLQPSVLKAKGPVQITEADLRPGIQQKGVDMRIGLDIAALTLKDHVDVIVLVTGDSDFVPAMKFARREGAQLFLFTLGHAVKDAMHEHADAVITARP